MVALL
jgi:hypothetical protein